MVAFSGSKNNQLSLFAWLLVSIFLLVAAFFYPKWNMSHAEATLSWDVMGYYYYLPAYFYDDITKLQNLQYILDTYRPVYGFGNAYLLPNGNYMMKYSMGMSIMYLPFFAIAHIWAQITGFAADGFSYPYQVMISFGSIIIAWIGLWFARKNLLRFFDDRIVAIILLILVFGTNYFNYVSFAGAMSHNYLFTVYSIVIWLSMSWYEKPAYSKSFLLGFLCGLAVVTRPSELIILIIPFLWGMNLQNEIPERWHLWRKHFLKLLLAAVAFAIPVLPQLFYWKVASGEWLYYSYQDQGFDWIRPHLYQGILTYRNGWLVYTPVMVLALVGFIFLYRKRKDIFWPTLLFTLINIYIVYSWKIWWYGGSFGSRAMIQSYALLIFPMAAFFDAIWKKRVINVLIGAGVLFAVWLNLLQTYQCHAKEIFEAENMTRAYYWRIFGRTSIGPYDRKMLDSKEELPARFNHQLETIYEVRSPGFDSLINPNSYSQNALVVLSDSVQFSQHFSIPIDNSKEAWYRASAMVFFPEKEWDVQQMTQFMIKFYLHKKEKAHNMMRIHRFTNQGLWQPVVVDIHYRTSIKADSLRISFWNANSNKKIYIDALKVEQVIVK